MSIFSEGERPADDEVQIAPGPAGYSENVNGSGEYEYDEDGEQPIESPREPFQHRLERDIDWIVNAPPLAVFILAASGATFTLLFLAIAKVTRGPTG